MYVHRGRRMISNKTSAREVRLYDPNGNWIPRSEITTHLAKFPDRTDVEAFIKAEDIILNEDAQITLTGIFESCRTLNEKICKQLLSIWKERRKNPSLLEQPQKQWANLPKDCNFTGCNPKAKSFNMDIIQGHPNVLKRMRTASVFGSQRSFWANSKWS